MIKIVPAEFTLALRSKVLRNGSPKESCIFPTDDLDGAFHLAFYLDDKIVTVASFFPNKHKNENGLGYQLRGMATDTPFLGRGYGKQLIAFAIDYLRGLNANYIWCNARTTAVKFYQKLGFDLISDEFEIAGVGLHYEMILKLKKI